MLQLTSYHQQYQDVLIIFFIFETKRTNMNKINVPKIQGHSVTPEISRRLTQPTLLKARKVAKV